MLIYIDYNDNILGLEFKKVNLGNFFFVVFIKDYY